MFYMNLHTCFFTAFKNDPLDVSQVDLWSVGLLRRNLITSYFVLEVDTDVTLPPRNVSLYSGRPVSSGLLHDLLLPAPRRHALHVLSNLSGCCPSNQKY